MWLNTSYEKSLEITTEHKTSELNNPKNRLSPLLGEIKINSIDCPIDTQSFSSTQISLSWASKKKSQSTNRHSEVSELLRRTINQTNILRVMVVKLAYLLYNIKLIELEMNPICQFSQRCVCGVCGVVWNLWLKHLSCIILLPFSLNLCMRSYLIKHIELNLFIPLDAFHNIFPSLSFPFIHSLDLKGDDKNLKGKKNFPFILEGENCLYFETWCWACQTCCGDGVGSPYNVDGWSFMA